MEDNLRFKKNCRIDGWPVEDTEIGVILDKDDLTSLLNQYHDALLLALYHHQGGKSEVGQRIRAVLGIDQYDELTNAQIERVRRLQEQTP